MSRLPILILLALALPLASVAADSRPRVFVFTDINIDRGDPDDRQSLIHLFWYADELDIQGVVPERWNAEGYEACELVVENYVHDYTEFDWGRRGYPAPTVLRDVIARDRRDAETKLRDAVAAASPDDPLHVLVWGNMSLVGEFLRGAPDATASIRLLTIGTHLLMEENTPHLPANWARASRPCEQPNWNGRGRNAIFNDSRFDQMWWLEMNWTYEGMFSGEEPKAIFAKLGGFGALGQHMHAVVKNEPWARYFRVGATPTVLYLIDPRQRNAAPTTATWAGRYTRPFPEHRPNYFADDAGSVDWNYADPCATWENHPAMRDAAKSTLEVERPAMYAALLQKLNSLYSIGSP